jgi:hypothetical protein
MTVRRPLVNRRHAVEGHRNQAILAYRKVIAGIYE